MNPPRAQSLTRRTLWRIAVVAGLGIVLATGVIYRIVFDAQAALRLEILAEYVSARPQREEGRFLVAESNLRILQEVVRKRLSEPAPADDAAWFQQYLAQTPDGAWRSRREITDPQQQASTWIRSHPGHEGTPEAGPTLP